MYNFYKLGKYIKPLIKIYYLSYIIDYARDVNMIKKNMNL